MEFLHFLPASITYCYVHLQLCGRIFHNLVDVLIDGVDTQNVGDRDGDMSETLSVSPLFVVLKVSGSVETHGLTTLGMDEFQRLRMQV